MPTHFLSFSSSLSNHITQASYNAPLSSMYQSKRACPLAFCFSPHLSLSLSRKEYGVHVFMVQLRDESHTLLPGIEAGDVGAKLGDHAIDTGMSAYRVT